MDLEVTEADTALAWRSGDVAVVATPRVLALMEEATCLVVADALEPGQTTVGVRVQIDHLAPVAVAGHIRAEATLEKVEGHRLVFAVSVRNDRGLVAAGRVHRVIVEIERFLERSR
ncbi:MAG: diguanylate cyclase/phosphodiesterase (GGDEF & EAL domains) with PAS/PAC sensor(s) [uncultured Acidimicrobiales bacterium]|uniref:Diguanylate cyclase/phosphodiesterase (GGDEF & EAL domains) with PAS/PAC sensor(S) n=1 Tax=uncultured Acidimicrobiales bacterium TaxID=310071 RepID=A0A6J4HBW2_9ACTN|nr:MAG: diguanylate cyclase/phosphodiesterase (GGDEF & EAL domains) with PAS/PAC sensor(s) [uncultured Acidimicrobiales bacterium]